MCTNQVLRIHTGIGQLDHLIWMVWMVSNMIARAFFFLLFFFTCLRLKYFIVICFQSIKISQIVMATNLRPKTEFPSLAVREKNGNDNRHTRFPRGLGIQKLLITEITELPVVEHSKRDEVVKTTPRIPLTRRWQHIYRPPSPG